MPSRYGFVALSAFSLSACQASLPPPDARLARHLEDVERALAATPADPAAAQRDAEAAVRIARERAAAGPALATVARSVAACRDAVAALADRAVSDPLLVELSAARATCRLAARGDALLANELPHGRD